MAHKMYTTTPSKCYRMALYVPAGERSPNFPDGPEDTYLPGKALIEFYDLRYSHTPDGQFIGRYYVETYMEKAQNGYGLDLYGSAASWKITSPARSLVASWIAYLLPASLVQTPPGGGA